jgi:hypothetical protein
VRKSRYGAQAGLTINAGGTFTISGDASLTAQAGVNPMNIYNSGTIQKTIGAPLPSKTNFDGEIDNQSSGAPLLRASAGTLSAFEIFQGAGTIQLSGGNLAVGNGGLNLGGGLLTGVGTITGNVDNGDPTGMEWTGAGTVEPGLNGSGRQLNITGNFTQTGAGWLQIDVNGGGANLGVLSISGTASLGGTLYINRNTAYTPTRGTSLTFLIFTGGRNGTDFNTVTYQNYVWTDPQNNVDQFNAQAGQNAYTLVVIGVSG